MKGLLLLLGLIGIANCIPTQYQDLHVYKCPELPADAIGTCSEDCSGDESCGSETQKCCSNGCGHVCMEAKVTTVSLPYYELPRQCPSEYPGGVACGSECAEDSDCETGELCCSGQTCGQACLAVPLPTCADVLEEVKKSALLGTYVPQCNEEGTAFSREQFWEGGTWCVDELTGKPESLGPCEEVQDGDQSDDSDGRHDDSDGRHGHHDGSHDHHDDSDGSKDGSKSDGSKSDGSKSDGSKSDESEDHPDKHHGGDGDHHNNGGHHGNGDPHGDIIYDYFEDDDGGRRKWWHPVLVGSVGFMLLLIGITIVLIIIMAVLIKKNKRFSHKPLTSSSSVNEDIDAVCYKDAIKMETLGKEYKPDAVA